MTANAQLRNAILFAVAVDATPAEIDLCIDSINRFFQRDGISPATIPSAIAGPGSTALQNTLPLPPSDDDGEDDAGETGGDVPALDSSGLPWDDRIHSSAKGRNKDGTWRVRKGADKKYVATIEAQIRAAMTATPAATQSAAPVVPTLPPLPTAAPSLPALPNLPPLPNAKFAEFMAFIAANTNSPTNPTGRLTDQYVNQIVQINGIYPPDVQALAHNEAVLDAVYRQIKHALGTTG